MSGVAGSFCESLTGCFGHTGATSACAEIPQPGDPKADSLYDAIDNDGDGVSAAEDCNDRDSAIRPGAEETCNNVDDDCDGEIDEDVRTTYFRDALRILGI